MAIHNISHGENLTKIAKRYNTTVDELIKLNPELKEHPNTIFEGDKLNIPDPPSKEPVIYDKKDNSLPKPIWQEGGDLAPSQPGKASQTKDLSAAEAMGWVAVGSAGTIATQQVWKNGIKPRVPLIRAKLTDFGKNAKAKMDAFRDYSKNKKTQLKDAVDNKYQKGKTRVKDAYNKGKAKIKNAVAGQKRALKAAAGEMKNNSFVKGDEKRLQKAYAESKAVTKKTINEAQGKNAKGKKVNTNAAQNLKNGYLNKDVHGAAKKSAQDAAKRKLVANPKAAGKSYVRSFKAGVKAVANSKALGIAGRTAAVAGVALEGYNVKKAYDKGGKKSAAKQAVKSATALGVAFAGAKAGAAAGAIGGPLGSIAGGIVGGALGYVVGSGVGKHLANAAGRAYKAIRG